MYYLYHTIEKKPISYDPVTDEYKTVSATRYLKIWDYQHPSNIHYMEQLVSRFTFITIKKLSPTALAKL